MEKIRQYTIKEEIPLVFTDVPAECLGNLLPLFRHANLDASDHFADSYTVRILSEAAALDELPVIEVDDEIMLVPPKEEDDAAYAELCRDKETNKYWGYDDLADCENPDDSYFREVAEMEFARGVAISLSILYNGEFAGEATLYHFDLLGGCQCAIRLLPAMRRLGIATRSLGALIEFAEFIGLCRVGSIVMEDNISSINLFAKHFSEIEPEREGLRSFSKEFDN